MNIIFLNNCSTSLVKVITKKINICENKYLLKRINNVIEIDNQLNKDFFDKMFLFHFLKTNENCEKEFLKINFLLNQSNVQVLVICDTFKEEIITNTFKNKFIGCLELYYFLNNTNYILESLEKFNSFYTSPMSINLYFNKIKTATEFNINLTSQQSKVACMLREGKSYHEISLELGISINTVRMHIKLIYKKLKIKNKVQLLALMSKSNLNS